ncbi:mesoderm induction early response protein 1-like [Acropora muricata]|uniref:mesoderm induction early response protein 1-like n=1 Tax=Acropora muricata TaxID=159855 RepID=UPI0034E4529C
MSRLAIFILVLSIASVVFMQANAATTHKRSLSSNLEGKLMEELEEENDEEEMNEEEDEDAELIEGEYNKEDEVADSPKEYYYDWIENDDAPMNSQLKNANDPRRCKFFCRLGCRRICRGCRPKCKLRCSRGCYYGK